MAKALSFQEAARRVHNRNEKWELVEYESTRKPAKIHCAECNHDTVFSRFEYFAGWTCPYCKENEARKNAEKEYRNILDERELSHIIISKFEGRKRPVTLTCNKCSWTHTYPDPHSIKSFRGCQNCDKRTRICWTTEKLNEEFLKYGSSLEVLEYNGQGKISVVHCNQCHNDLEMKISTKRIAEKNYVCPICKQKEQDLCSVENKIQRSRDNISMISYDSSSRVALLKCQTCSTEWEEKANQSIDCFRCPKCKEDRRTGRAFQTPIEDYRQRLNEAGMEDVEIIDYQGYNAPVTLYHRSCQKEFTFSEARRSFNGCPHCNPKSTQKTTLDIALKKLSNRGLDYIEIVNFKSGKQPGDFRCTKCGYEWIASEARDVLDRLQACPHCHGLGIDPETNEPFPYYRPQVDIVEAQLRLDERNAEIELLEFNGLDYPSKMKCKTCGTIWEEDHTRDVIRRTKFGCKNCMIREHETAIKERWQRFIDEHYDNIEIVNMQTAKNNQGIRLKCTVCGHEWERENRGFLKNERLWHTILCEKCNPRFIPGRKISKEAFFKMMKEKTDGSFECISYENYNTKATFKCSEGHTWNALPSQVIVRKTGCPFCHKNVSFPEQALYYYLSTILDCDVYCNPTLIFENGKQYRPDVFIPDYSYIVEYDGYRWHADKVSKTHDIEREIRFTLSNINVIHFKEVRKQKGKYRFYAVKPYWIDTSSNGQFGRNDRISEAITDFIKSHLDINKELDIDLNRNKIKVRKFWKEHCGDESAIFIVQNNKDGSPFFTKQETNF